VFAWQREPQYWRFTLPCRWGWGVRGLRGRRRGRRVRFASTGGAR
jgi:hypothetical protein